MRDSQGDKMNCLFIYRFCTLGGVETSIINKSEALQKEKINCTAVFDYDDNKRLYAKYPQLMIGLSEDEKLKLLKRNYDFVIFIDYPNFFSSIEKITVKSKFIFETHTSYLPALESYYQDINSRLSAVVVPSRFNQKLVQHHSKTKQKISVIPNPINQGLFSNKPIRIKDRTLIIWVGRFDPGKNLFEFIQIANQLLEIRPAFHFIIVGDSYGEHYHNYRQKVEGQIKAENRRAFTFWQKVLYVNMPYLYSLAANTGGCLVCTSLHESLPMVMVEAMACHCPVVTTNVGGIGELISDNLTGKFYQQGNLKSAVEAILDLANPENKVRREKIIINASKKIDQNHSFKVFRAKYKELLSSL